MSWGSRVRLITNHKSTENLTIKLTPTIFSSNIVENKPLNVNNAKNPSDNARNI